MPEKETLERARRDKRQGKSASTQAGEFVHEEIHHIRRGKHGARSTKQAIAIGLSKARRAGVKLEPPEDGKASTKRSAKQALKRGKSHKKVSATRSRATRAALKDEGKRSASKKSLSRQAKSAAKQRSARERSAAAKKAARTKGPDARSAAARKAARTRARHAA